MDMKRTDLYTFNQQFEYYYSIYIHTGTGRPCELLPQKKDIIIKRIPRTTLVRAKLVLRNIWAPESNLPLAHCRPMETSWRTRHVAHYTRPLTGL